VGDALGAPVEFMRLREIQAKYGPGGIQDMDVAYGVRGAVTDDTQMTLFTAEGIIRADARFSLRGICNPFHVVRRAYVRWLATQGELGDPGALVEDDLGWLYHERRLHVRRAPGNTCLAALRNHTSHNEAAAENDSKGCGGVMRIAPVGLVAHEPFDFGSKIARITHGHVLGYVSAGALALMVSRLKEGETMERAVQVGIEAVAAHGELHSILRKAVELARSQTPAEECIQTLGEGWVAEEALAISVFCALRAGSFEEGVVMAVNHSGDSDSTGSIAGQLLGTAMGEEAIPQRWLEHLEMREVVQRVADDMYEWFVVGVLEERDGWPSVSDEWWKRYPGC
jgi:ADP-ribosyl-[dinitrogen reductase] hydrolase